MKNKKGMVILIIVLVVIGLLTIFLVIKNRKEVMINTTVIGDGTVELTVMATGYVQPVDQVEVGTQVSGVIEKIYVDYNSQVKKGDLLAELDKSTLSEQVNQANANFNSATSNLSYAKQNLDRVQNLYNAKAATGAALEEAQNQYNQALQSLNTARANRNQTTVNLSYAEIYSPIDGVVLERAVEEGQTVAASFSTPTLFTIANDLTKMQVEADVDEADIGNVRNGQSVTFTVDAFSEDIFEGQVQQIRLQPVVTNNVVTYTVIVEAPNPDEKLYPGMTASITIVTEREQGLIVPIEALNFRWSEDVASRMDIEAPAPTGRRSGGIVNGMGRVWVVNNGEYDIREVQVGISDGVNAIIKSGLQTGDEVILSASLEKKSDRKGEAYANPLVPRGPGGRR